MNTTAPFRKVATRKIYHRSALFLVACALAGFLSLAPRAAATIQSQDTNIPGVVADFVQCRSKDGVLTVKVRLRNTSDKPVEFSLIANRNYDDFYVTAGSKKYYVLRDTERDPLAVGADGFGFVKVELAAGGVFTWWAKYPSPPAGEATINYVMPIAPPFEDVPVER